jgi:hypothetical protein
MTVTQNATRKSRNYRWPEVILSVTVWVMTALAFHSPPAPRAHGPGPGTSAPSRRQMPSRVYPERRTPAPRATALG